MQAGVQQGTDRLASRWQQSRWDPKVTLYSDCS